MKHGLTYRDFHMRVEILTSGEGLEKVERKVFVADNGQHRIAISTKHGGFIDLVELAKKKIDKRYKCLN